MREQTQFAVLACLLIHGTVLLAGQDRGYWRAASSSANQITGDIGISENKLTIDLGGYSLAQIRKLTAAELQAVFDAEGNSEGQGNLFRLRIPADKRFLHRNTLCGSEDTEWMATYAEGRSLHVVFFSGDTMPVLTRDGLANSSDVCGTFTYVR